MNQALIIGVNDYYEDSGLTKLKYAEKDAHQLASLLTNEFKYEVTPLLGKQATRIKIMKEFEKLSKSRNGKNFLFFFAGHGQVIDDEFYLHPINGKLNSDIYSFRLNRLLDYFEKKISHRNIIGIIDACHKSMSTIERGENGLTKSATIDVANRIQLGQNNDEKLIKILYGCGINQASYEDDKLRNGVLSHFLIKNIKEYGHERSFDEIAKELGEEVPNYVSTRFNAKQSPVLFTPLTKRETWITDSYKEPVNKIIKKNPAIKVFDKTPIQEEVKPQPMVEKQIDFVKEKETKSKKKEDFFLDKQQTQKIQYLSATERKSIYKSLQLKLVKVEGGHFLMGCDSATILEKPIHKVNVNSFYMSAVPVTNYQYAVFRENLLIDKMNGKVNEEKYKPINNINWQESFIFCNWLSKLTGKKFRLPTEAEWEFAANGGNKSKHLRFSGSNNLSEVGWFIRNSNRSVMNVGQKIPNELGLYDMCGNVNEWCVDWFADDYYIYSDADNPLGPENGFEKVVRGGSSNYNEYNCRTTNRKSLHPNMKSFYCGFRIVMEL